MEITSVIVDILKLGLTGLVFLLMFLGFRLLSKEQQKTEPNVFVIKRASLFVWQSILVACLVAGAEIGHRFVDQKAINTGAAPRCLEELGSLYLVSKHPAQTIDTLRSSIQNTWIACGEPEASHHEN
jgi:hypothetical protein